MDIWSSAILYPEIVSILVIVVSAIIFFIWLRSWRSSSNDITPNTSPQEASRNNENGQNGGDSSAARSVSRARRKRYSMLNSVSQLATDVRNRATGSVRRAKRFGRDRLESMRKAISAPQQQLVDRLTNILLPSETPTKHTLPHPPSVMFDDVYGEEEGNSQMAGLARAVRSFCWQVEKPVLQGLSKSVETLSFEKGDMVFEQGSKDDGIFVVVSGQIDLLIIEENKDTVIKSIKAGGNVFSMIAILETLAGQTPVNSNVAARMAESGQVARLPIKAFCSLAENDSDLTFATIQTIMIKLSRVVFNALHACLGLSGELVRDFRSAATVQTLARSVSLSSSEGLPKRRVFSRKREPLKRFATQDYQMKEEPAVFSASTMQHTQHSIQEVISRLGELKIIEAVLADLMVLFGVSDRVYFESSMRVENCHAGTQIHGQDERAVDLIVVVHGILNAYTQTNLEDQAELFFTAHPGCLLGQLSILSGEPCIYSLRAKTDAIFVLISRKAVCKLVKERPQAAVAVSSFLTSELSPFVRQLDHSLGWQQIEAGRSLYRQNDVAESAYVILHGRLRIVLKKSDDSREVISEHGRDEFVGLVEILSRSRRMFTSLAVRDTEVGSIPTGLINWLKRTHPKIVTRLIHVIGNRMADVRMRATAHSVEQPLPVLRNRPPLRNLSTVAVLPASRDVPLSSFTLELQHSLNAIGPSLRLTGMLVMSQLGAAAFDAINEYHLQTWLSQQEEAYRMIIYQCDSTYTPWSRWCMRQADAVLVVALASADPSVSSPVEDDLDRFAVRAQKELVLLYKHNFEGRPRNTQDWLATRGWCHGHHHIRCPRRVLATSSPNRIISTYRKLFERDPNIFSDFSRLARYLTGTSIGLCLGGGGARGMAHIGIFRAMVEAGIPVDMVAGTSIGSFISALWAREVNISKMTETASKMSARMMAKTALVYDLTYPYAGIFTGRNFNSIIRDAVCGDNEDGYDTQIEDLWLPYACVTTDVTASKMRIHTSGSLWRYIRASMTLAGYMPPLCDPADGHLLVDGGYTNNLPADVLRAMGCSVVFTVDVGSVDDTELTNYGDELSGWALIWKRFWPWASSMKVPNIADIQSRLAYVACCRQLEIVKQQPYCIYVRPPIDKYKTLAFNLFDEINKAGYSYGRKFFSIINVPRFFYDLYNQRALAIKSATSSTSQSNKAMQAQLYQQQLPKNFTELAELICQIEPEIGKWSDSESDSGQLSLDTIDAQQLPLPMLPLGLLDGEGGSNNESNGNTLTIPGLDGNHNNGQSGASSVCGTLTNSRSNSRRSSIRAAVTAQQLSSNQHLDDSSDDYSSGDGTDGTSDFEEDPVFDEVKNLNGNGRSLIEQDRSLSDTELPSAIGSGNGSNRQALPHEAESLPITAATLRSHASLSD